MFKRWAIFVKERFEPLTNITTLLLIYTANGLIASGGFKGITKIPLSRTLPGFILFILVFFHMRLFDEIKDYDTDKLINPERPLPRGLISLKEHGFGTLIVITFELLIAYSLGTGVLFSYLALLSFTLIMRQEFFIGDWLRPKMEAYAITHTFSAYLAGLLVYSVFTGMKFTEAPSGYLLAVFSNWFVFNVYEFGRKTYGNNEKDIADNYSKRLGAKGAALLLYSNVAAAYIFLLFHGSYLTTLLISVILVIPGIVYIRRFDEKGSKIYRNSVTAYLALFYATVILENYLRIT